MPKEIISMKRCVCQGIAQDITLSKSADHKKALQAGYQAKADDYLHKSTCAEVVYVFYNSTSD